MGAVSVTEKTDLVSAVLEFHFWGIFPRLTRDGRWCYFGRHDVIIQIGQFSSTIIETVAELFLLEVECIASR